MPGSLRRMAEVVSTNLVLSVLTSASRGRSSLARMTNLPGSGRRRSRAENPRRNVDNLPTPLRRDTSRCSTDSRQSVVNDILLELLDRDSVHPRRALVLPHLLPGNPYLPLRDLERLVQRLQRVHATPLRASLRLIERTSHGWPGPFAPPRLSGLRHYYGPVRRRAPHRYSAPYGFRRLSALPLAIPSHGAAVVGTRLPTFRAKAADRAHVASMPDTAWPEMGHPPGSSRDRF